MSFFDLFGANWLFSDSRPELGGLHQAWIGSLHTVKESFVSPAGELLPLSRDLLSCGPRDRALGDGTGGSWSVETPRVHDRQESVGSDVMMVELKPSAIGKAISQGPRHGSTREGTVVFFDGGTGSYHRPTPTMVVPIWDGTTHTMGFLSRVCTLLLYLAMERMSRGAARHLFGKVREGGRPGSSMVNRWRCVCVHRCTRAPKPRIPFFSLSFSFSTEE